MLIGVYSRVIDDDMRICLPKGILAHIEDEGCYVGKCLYVAVSYDRALCVFCSIEDANEFLNDKQAYDITGGSQLFETARCLIDKRGRVTLPRLMAAKVSILINTEVFVVGAGSYFEIWSALEWLQPDNHIGGVVEDIQNISALF